jgi:ribosomal protein S6--L-glutamate ligase
MDTKRNLLFIASKPDNYSTTRLVEEAEKRGHEVTVLTPDDFYLHVSNVTSGHDKVFIKSGRVFKKDVDCIIPRISGDMAFGCAVVRHWSQNLRVPTTATAEGLTAAADKWRTTQLLSKNRIRTPLTTLMKRPEDFGQLIKTVGGLPAVAKTLRGSQGKGVFILETPLAGSTALSAFANSDAKVLLQQYIESADEGEDERKSDLRVWVINGQVAAAYRRFSVHKDFRSNYSISGEGETAELTAEEKTLAVNAALAVGLYCCGVDIVRDARDNGRPYVLEVNGNASLKGIETVTKINLAGKVIDFVELLCKGQRDKARVEDQQAALMTPPDPRAKYFDRYTLKAMGRK